MRRRLPQGVRMYHRRRLQLRRADRGRRAGLFRRAARHLRRHRAGRLRRARRVHPRRRRGVPRDPRRRPCRCRATSSRRRRASTRPASCSWPGSTACRIISPWSAARRARARPCIWPSCSGSPTPPGCSPIRTGGAAHEARHGDARCPLMRDLSKDRSLLAINSATVKPWTLEQLVEGCVRAGITAIAPWRDIVQAAGVEKAGNMIRAAGLTVTCYCRGGLFPAADEAGRRAALDDNRRAVDEAAAIGARSLVLIAGGLPKGSKDLAGAHAAGPRRHRGAAALRARRRRAAGDRAAASDVCRRPRLREHARRMPTISATSSATASASRSMSITSGGIRTWPRRSRAPASASSPITSATGWCRPGTCCSTAACRATASSICARSAPWWRRPATTAHRRRDFLRAELVEARAVRGAADLPGAAPDGGVIAVSARIQTRSFVEQRSASSCVAARSSTRDRALFCNRSSGGSFRPARPRNFSTSCASLIGRS